MQKPSFSLVVVVYSRDSTFHTHTAQILWSNKQRIIISRPAHNVDKINLSYTTFSGTMNNSTIYINAVNTRAIKLLQQSRHKKAICCLKKGLKFVLDQADNTNSTDRPSLVPFTFEAQQQSMQGGRSSIRCLASMDIEDDETALTCTVAIPEVHDTMSSSPENVFVVFNRAFTYHEEHGVLKSSADYTKATATLLYNMGIAFHQLGMQENNTAALKKSLYSYQMAYKILSQKCDDSFSCLVMLALCNNMSHIHGHFFNLREAKSFSVLLTEILACVSLTGLSVAVDDYDFFVSEAVIFEGRERELECAPAA
jgi:hypothetical protein